RMLDRAAIAADPSITDDDLKAAIRGIHSEFDYDLPTLKRGTREHLVDELQKALKMAMRPVDDINEDHHKAGEVVINPSAKWTEQIDNSAVHIGSNLQSSINAG